MEPSDFELLVIARNELLRHYRQHGRPRWQAEAAPGPRFTRPRGPTFCLPRGLHEVVAPGDQITNGYTSSCALVLAHGRNGILAYHWPGLEISYTAHFGTLTQEVRPLSRIFILTNHLSEADRHSYFETARLIQNDQTPLVNVTGDGFVSLYQTQQAWSSDTTPARRQ